MENITHAPIAHNIIATIFDRNNQPQGRRFACTWDALCTWLESSAPVADAKHNLPLIKLATFRDDYRRADALETVAGLEGDYDAGAVTPEEAAERLKRAGVMALVVTTPSHTPLAPRWRVFCPLARDYPPHERERLVRALDAFLGGGVLAPESYVPAQCFYVGSVKDGEPARYIRTDGAYLDDIATIMPGTLAVRSGRHALGAGGVAPDYATALAILQHQDVNADRGHWLAISGGFASSVHGLPGAERALEDWQNWNADYEGTNDPSANLKTWNGFLRDGTAHTWAEFQQFAPPAIRGALLFGGGTQIPAPMIQGQRPFFVKVSEMVSREPEWLIEGLIEADSLGMIFGESGSGKSFVSIDLAACIASGHEFHGHTVKAGPVFYIAGEGRNGLKRRFDAWSEMQGIPLHDAPLFTSDGQAASFLDVASANMVAQSIVDLAVVHGAPRLIVVDTLARNFGQGDENNQRDASRFVAVLDALKALWQGCSLLIVHHSGHVEKDRARGSSVLKAALDCEFKVEKDEDEISLSNTKMKDGPTPKPMVFKLQSIEQSAALEYVGEYGNHRQPLTQQQQAVYDAFRAIGKDGATIEAWRAQFYATHEGTPDAKRKAFQRASELIISRNYIIKDGDFYKFPPMPGMTEPKL